MGFFKEFKEDLQQAVNELLPDDIKDDSSDQMVNTLDSDEAVQNTEAESERMKELLEEIAQDGAETAFGSDSNETVNSESKDEVAMDDNVDQELLDTLNADDEEKQQAGTLTKDTERSVSKAKPAQKVQAASVNEEDVTVITKGTRINGSISTDGSLDIRGTVIGDIECLGKLSVTGHVKGNTTAAEVYINTDRFDGSIVSNGSVKIALGTVVVGDITAKSAVFAGAVKGEIDINGPVVIDSTAIIKGNIKAKSVQVNNGAVIDGYCSLAYADVDLDNIFE